MGLIATAIIGAACLIAGLLVVRYTPKGDPRQVELPLTKPRRA